MRRLTERLAEFAGTLDGIAFINPHDRQGVYNLKEIVDWAEDFYLYKIANRLAAYEDTGLTPEEVKELADKAEAQVDRLRLMVKSITGGLDEAIEAVHFLETENAKLQLALKKACDMLPACPDELGRLDDMFLRAAERDLRELDKEGV